MRAAFVVPLSVRIEEFFSDILMSLCSSDLREAGHQGRVFKVYYDREDAPATAAARARLVEEVAGGEFDLLVFEWVWDTDAIAAIRAARAASGSRRPIRSVLLDPISPIEHPELDFVARHNPRRTFARLVEALAAGRDGSAIPGLWWRAEGRDRPLAETAPAEAEEDEFARDYRPDLDATVIGASFAAVTRKTLHGNPGCPHALPAARNPFFKGADLSGAEVVRLGCSFCHMGGDYLHADDDATVDSLLSQAAYLQTRLPELHELIVRDNHAIRLLPRLIDESVRRGVRPVEYLFMARADALLRGRETLREACRRAAATGFALHCYLVGFENFSPAELERYNKGETVDTLLAAVRLLRETEAEFSGTFDRGRYRTHSLILYNPWTNLDDLRANARALREHGLGDLFRSVGLHKLRLYESLPLTRRALADGLVAPAFESAAHDNASRMGYSAEIPWRFSHPEVACAYDLGEALEREVGNAREFALFEAILDLVERAGVVDVAALTRDLRRLRRLLERGGELPGGGLAALDAEPDRGAPDNGWAELALSGPCNNACGACPNHDEPGVHGGDDFRRALAALPAGARGVWLRGREPTLREDLPALLAEVRRAGFSGAGLVTNGRRLAYPAYARALRDAGLTRLRIKLFGPDAPSAEAVTRAERSHAQALAGLRNATRMRGVDTGARLVVTRAVRDRLAEMVDVAAGAGARLIEFDCPVDGIGLDQLAETCAAIAAAAARARQSGVEVTCLPLRERMATPPRPRLRRAAFAAASFTDESFGSPSTDRSPGLP